MSSHDEERPNAAEDAVSPIIENIEKLAQAMRIPGAAVVDFVPLPLLRNIKDDLDQLSSLVRREEEKRHTAAVLDGSADGGGGDTWPASQAYCVEGNAVQVNLDPAAMDLQLQRCLSFLGAFPAERNVKKSLLFHWLISEDIVDSVQEAKECMDRLLASGLVLPVRLPHCDKAHAFAAHRTLRSRLEAAGTPPASAVATRLHITDTRFHPQLGDVNNGVGSGSVVELYNIQGKYMCLQKEWMANQTSMRVLQLGRQWSLSGSQHAEVAGTGFLESVGACHHLRYLSLRGVSVVESLPDQIGELGNLVVLDLQACHNLEKLPESVGSLKKLEYLDVSECYLLDHMPSTICNLSHLEVLKGFVASRAPRNSTDQQLAAGEPRMASLFCLRGWRKAKEKARSEPCRLSDLGKLKKLRKLSIFNYGASGHAHDDLRELSACAELRSLTITWASGTPPSAADGQTVQLDATLPAGIRKLDLRRMPYGAPPSWLTPAKLQNLEKLCIRGGLLALLDSVDGGSVWTSVETLRLRFLREFACEWEALHQWFPQLRVLEHWHCRNLSKWRRELGAQMRYFEVNHIQDFFYGDQNLCPWDVECDDRGIWRKGTDASN
ncbi:hypothetical protein GUJ93_ZPchr0009g1901 [Zizania palustris]|uniref:Disease resistance R13L4/SHOC-2-like LRR domain-containing protein n=1 Tax=Zizania palustris TaxID=103762 RepID=A0A8J5RYL5_ZIZPA|nr:hypothetical protein GUJ93_ZPchr0009g1901 [Zizania palustris]